MTSQRRLKTHFRAICGLTTLTTRQALTQGRVAVALGSGSLGTMTTNMPYCTRRTTITWVIHLLTMERYQYPTDRLTTPRRTTTPATVVRMADIVTRRSMIWITQIHHHHMIHDNIFFFSRPLSTFLYNSPWGFYRSVQALILENWCLPVIEGSWSSITYLSHKDSASFDRRKVGKYMLDVRLFLSLRNEI